MAPKYLQPPAPRLLPHGGMVLILGSGPSLTREDVTYARAHVALTIAVNDSYLYAPDADVLYAGDGQWWRNHQFCRTTHRYQGHTFPPFTGLRCSVSAITNAVYEPDIMLFKQGPQMGLSLDPLRLATGKNGAYQALNLAVHVGGTGAVLLGVDMKPGKVFRDGHHRESAHFFGRHVDNSEPPYAVCLQRFETLVQPLAKIGFTVVNCTPKSALHCFDMKPLRELFPEAVAV